MVERGDREPDANWIMAVPARHQEGNWRAICANLEDGRAVSAQME